MNMDEARSVCVKAELIRVPSNLLSSAGKLHGSFFVTVDNFDILRRYFDKNYNIKGKLFPLGYFILEDAVLMVFLCKQRRERNFWERKRY